MIETAVIGVGHLGQHHARILHELEGSKLKGIVDMDEKRAQQIAKSAKTTAYPYYKDLFGQVQAVVIAVPTPLHYQIGKDCLEAGIHCLIEKPFTEDVEQAEELIKIAQEKNLDVVEVGPTAQPPLVRHSATSARSASYASLTWTVASMRPMDAE